MKDQVVGLSARGGARHYACDKKVPRQLAEELCNSKSCRKAYSCPANACPSDSAGFGVSVASAFCCANFVAASARLR